MGLRNQTIEKSGRVVNIMEETLSDGSKAYNLQIVIGGGTIVCDTYDVAFQIYNLMEKHCD